MMGLAVHKSNRNEKSTPALCLFILFCLQQTNKQTKAILHLVFSQLKCTVTKNQPEDQVDSPHNTLVISE